MIFNRTLSDVEQAKKIRAEKLQHFVEITDEEQETLERGFVTINTLNRIEDKQSELQNLLRTMGYWNTSIISKTWTSTDMFTDAEFQRIIDNNAALRKSFYVYSNSPMDAIANYHYEEFNAIERILFDLEAMIAFVRGHYKECGDFDCGEE